jgi:hypothetical protein
MQFASFAHEDYSVVLASGVRAAFLLAVGLSKPLEDTYIVKRHEI